MFYDCNGTLLKHGQGCGTPAPKRRHCVATTVRFTCAALVAVLAGCSVTVPVRVANSGDWLIVPMSINGVPGTFVLDTGAPTTVSKQFADRIGLWNEAIPFDVPFDPDNPQPPYGAHYAPIESFTVGSIRGPRNSGQVLIIDLSHVSAVVGEKVDGFLGNSTLGSADYVLNVRQPSLKIAGNLQLAGSSQALPLKVGGFNGYRTYLPVTINGKSFDLLLDTGSNITEVTPEVLSALGGIETEFVEGRIASINGVETGPFRRFRAAVKLGNVSVPEFTFFVGNGNRIGLDLLAFGELSISVNERRFVFRNLHKP